MKLFKYKLRWSPYFTGLKAKNKKKASAEIQRQWPKAKGNFYIFLN